MGRQAKGIMAKPNKSNVIREHYATVAVSTSWTLKEEMASGAKAGTLLVDMQGQRQLGQGAVCYLLRSGEDLQKNSN
jgi:hypothetical protein